MTRKIALPTLALALALPAGLAAQTILDVGSLTDIEDIDVVTADGENLGGIEAVLVDDSGSPAAVSVEVGGFLGIGDSDRVIPVDRLTFQDGDYVVDIAREEVEELPAWDD